VRRGGRGERENSLIVKGKHLSTFMKKSPIPPKTQVFFVWEEKLLVSQKKGSPQPAKLYTQNTILPKGRRFLQGREESFLIREGVAPFSRTTWSGFRDVGRRGSSEGGGGQGRVRTLAILVRSKAWGSLYLYEGAIRRGGGTSDPQCSRNQLNASSKGRGLPD